ncbi:MAG: SDR family NAD(P)-dependent oxidoreductase [Bacteroidales bacterium]|nr:SDR family NAD(P)-dependent oxidoreductase [Bacteroidales bacterium]
MNILGKTILITGASSGIGESLALQLSKMGAKVALFARRKEKLEKIKNEIITYNPHVITIPCDVRNRGAVISGVKEVIDNFNGIDILINNAGLGYFGTIENMKPEHIYDVFETNVIGPVNLIQVTLPYLKQSKGIIVNISSSLSKRALPFLSAYAGSKSMLDGITDGIRLELKPYGIKVINYCPPETETEFHNSSIKEEGIEMSTKGRKFVKPNVVANEIIRSIIKGKREVVKGKFLKIMNFFAPRFLDRIFYKYMVLKIKNENDEK